MTVNTDASRVRCYGNDVGGYEDAPVECGPVQVRLAKILTRECAMVINLPILKDHEMAGITFSMKNMYGVVDKPFLLHPNNCNPGVADVNAIPAVREKVWFTIGDAISSVYDGGPAFHPERLWYPNALVVGEDRVAARSHGVADDRAQARRQRECQRSRQRDAGPITFARRRTRRTGWGRTIRGASGLWKCDEESAWRMKVTKS